MWSRSCFAICTLLASLLLAGCSGDSGSGPLDTKWDRDSCERCRMVLSDRYHGAQVRYFPPDKKRSVVAHFDDIGCAVLWLSGTPWEQDPMTQIWVTDRNTGAWIDAVRATYVKGDHTPMEYGLGAQEEASPDGLNFTEAKRHIHAAEQRHQHHTAHLLQRFREQAAIREGMKTERTQTGEGSDQ
ncbi:MAG: nitrous oxide reductase accessory protein NosL [Candidatus Thiodiazotropha sp. (ex Ctena orbiculata)]|uniref:Nitrous oxide reductase accessory protein NosL n=1 Tax=Candidatus Thiodiazotropha taylori TaxID=2792791 RepID=A0A944QVC0_9GAMM|nr:nitrous oxide reductase accessory protein NosL [Candidatus Thiodiazotropha taylori]PUB89997.1 MAG: hypothetical protein DBP00_00925 [gamma proteobacterium symbiont of Ctena orbiculata]MBT2991067.1 nitrous oxide reductase accessory protein NosL [Candidatus Thiodiazotropha taylori]MBT2996595.1 nitrous oxide reductase accessory protein NosL [Candidatus Thiodiazotropha taylori]MBT3000635.1 nitrous oxide reductase accessory protein NosL [Candidatus Thiodiazotropha taylori]